MKLLPAAGLDLDPFRVSLLEKLERFHRCVDFSGFGEGKAEKAMLCALDLLSKKEKPNLLILCPDRFAHSWYGAALLRLGLEFKIASGAKDSVYFFSPRLSNLFIIPEDVLSEEDAPVLTEMRESGIIWDLIIADASGNTDGAELSLYEKLGMKAEKVLLFAPYPAAYNDAPSQIPTVIKSLLKDDPKDEAPITPEITAFSTENPYLNYPAEEKKRRAVRTVDYEIDPKRIPKNLRFEESQGGGRYPFGGNIFEEYDLEERKIYLRPSYTHTEAEILKNTDAKLKAFLDVIDPIIGSEDQTAVVYFGSDATLSYVEKILSALYFEKRANVAALNRFGLRRIREWFEEEPEQKIRVLLAKDGTDELFALYSPVTHIINYELPDNPAVLQQRFKRRGMAGGEDPEFILFCDSEGMFDGRVLKKALAGNLYKAFRRELPCENILLRVEGIEKILTEMLLDIKYIADYTGSVGSSFDVISRFKTDYAIPAERNLTTAARTHEYSANKLSVLASALGVSELISAKETDKAALLAAVTEKAAALREGYACFDDKMTLTVLPRSAVQNDELKKFTKLLDGNPYYEGVKRAKASLKKTAFDAGGYAYLKNEILPLSDLMRPVVLYHVWLYWHKELGYGGSYEAFMQAYNDGII